MPPGWGGIGQLSMPVASMPGLSQSANQVPGDTDSRVPVINLKDGTRLAGDDAPKRKDLDLWLKEHPGFVADTGAFIPVSTVFFSSLHFSSLILFARTDIFIVKFRFEYICKGKSHLIHFKIKICLGMADICTMCLFSWIDEQILRFVQCIAVL